VKTKIVIMLILFVSLTGCTVCRHSAMLNAAKIYESGHDVEFVMYTTGIIPKILSLGVFNAHVQATYIEDGKRKWISSGMGVISDEPDYAVGKYCWVMSMKEYVKYLKNYKVTSAMPMPTREYREKHWPKKCLIRGAKDEMGK